MEHKPAADITWVPAGDEHFSVGMDLSALVKNAASHGEYDGEEKLKKASINNVAYAFQNIHNAKRLESGQSTSNIGISIEAKLAKALDKAHKTDDTINNKVQD